MERAFGVFRDWPPLVGAELLDELHEFWFVVVEAYAANVCSVTSIEATVTLDQPEEQSFLWENGIDTDPRSVSKERCDQLTLYVLGLHLDILVLAVLFAKNFADLQDMVACHVDRLTIGELHPEDLFDASLPSKRRHPFAVTIVDGEAVQFGEIAYLG